MKQTRLKPLNIWERFLEKHGEWYREKKGLESMLEGKEALKPFNLTYATANQREAIDKYMRMEGKRSRAGFGTWMRWNEKTYYDILKDASPDE